MNKLEYIPGDIVKIEYGEATGKIGFVTNTFLERHSYRRRNRQLDKE